MEQNKVCEDSGKITETLTSICFRKDVAAMKSRRIEININALHKTSLSEEPSFFFQAPYYNPEYFFHLFAFSFVKLSLLIFPRREWQKRRRGRDDVGLGRRGAYLKLIGLRPARLTLPLDPLSQFDRDQPSNSSSPTSQLLFTGLLFSKEIKLPSSSIEKFIG